GHNARTYIWDALDLDAPELIGTYTSSTPSIDHNLYTRGNYVYQANYLAGLRILSLTKIGQGNLKQVAFFDTSPLEDARDFGGAWGVYPYFESGVLAVSTFDDGLFLLAADLSPAASSVRALSLDKVTCRDQTDRETSRINLNGERTWNCFKTDLNMASGDRLRQTLLGDATGSNVRGTLKGVSPSRILCSNRTQGTKVSRRTTDPKFSCRNMGLDIESGDRIQIKAWGRVN
ncbi:MAG: choice-of-anchor B family protein, partial [Thermoanaerobaculia bacterium]